MAFLDNSGDIILDAVLTELGRVKLSQGQFNISKFALGDDEIQYSLYDKNHPSGSAYSDLEILQTPIEVAHTKTPGINYGLLSLTRTDLLYLPSLVPNDKVTQATATTSSVYYIAANQETNDYLVTAFGSSKYNVQQNIATGQGVFFESGLNTSELKGTQANRRIYLQANNMLDSTFALDVDSRFVVGVMGPNPQAPGTTFANTLNGNSNVSVPNLTSNMVGASTSGMPNYNSYAVSGIPNRVYYFPGMHGMTSDTATSALSGPRGTAVKLNLVMDGGLIADSTGTRDIKYSQYGSTGQNLFGDGNTYDYIDTTVYLTGVNTTKRTQLRVRLIRTATT